MQLKRSTGTVCRRPMLRPFIYYYSSRNHLMPDTRNGGGMSGNERMDGEMSLARLAANVRAAAREVSGAQRYVLGIAGPPAAGKSTLAELLRDEINEQSESRVAEIA